MSQKRKISKYPPTEGETEDTTVIVEPTSAVQKRSRTTLSRGSKNTSEPNDDIAVALPADVAADAVEIAPPEVVVTTTTTAIEKVDGDYVNEDDNDDADMTDDVVNGDVAATNSPKKKSGLSNLDMPSHLNPSNPAHFDHFLFYLLVVRAESENPAQNICKEEYPLLYAWIQHVKKEYKIYVSQAPNCQLTAQQVLVLESLHVPLTSRGDDHWNRYYEFLVQYRNRHGHVLVPRLCEVPGLGDWVTDQRRQYKAKQQGQASQMTTARQELLEELEFVWHVRNRPEWVGIESLAMFYSNIRVSIISQSFRSFSHIYCRKYDFRSYCNTKRYTGIVVYHNITSQTSHWVNGWQSNGNNTSSN